MSEVKRFFTALGFDPEPYVEMIEDTDGNYVYYEDYESLRAKLSEAQREIERLKKHACEYSAVDNAIINPCGFVMKLLEKFEQAESENAALRERLKPVEEVYQNYNHGKGLYCDMQVVCDLWQAIKAACERK